MHHPIYVATLGPGDLIFVPPGFVFTELSGIQPNTGIKFPVLACTTDVLTRLHALKRDFELFATVPKELAAHIVVIETRGAQKTPTSPLRKRSLPAPNSEPASDASTPALAPGGSSAEAAVPEDTTAEDLESQDAQTTVRTIEQSNNRAIANQESKALTTVINKDEPPAKKPKTDRHSTLPKSTGTPAVDEVCHFQTAKATHGFVIQAREKHTHTHIKHKKNKT